MISFRKRTHIFRVIGQFLAKAMLDSRIIDLSFNKIFLKIILGEEVPLTLSTLKVRCIVTFALRLLTFINKLVDRDLANSLAKLQSYASSKGGNDKVWTDDVYQIYS
jgi:E3 ubiquitin-protein ligase TRIP12